MDSQLLTDSQKLTLQEQIYSLDQIYRATEVVDEKAMVFLKLASLIWVLLVFLATIKIMWLILLFSAIMILMVYVSLPTVSYHPGTSDWEQLYTEYVNQDSNACFDQVLSDYSETMVKMLEINECKSRIVRCSAILFCVQIIGVIIGIII